MGPETLERWVFLILFCAGSMSINLSGYGFASVALSAAKLYGVHVNLINALTMASFIASCFAYFPSMFVVDNYPVMVALCIGLTLGLAGSSIRFMFEDFFFCTVGQLLMAFASPFVNSAPAAIGKEYFPPNQRAIVTSFGTLAQLLGMGSGLGIGPMFKDNLSRWLEIQMLTVAVPSLGVFLFLAVHVVCRRRISPHLEAREEQDNKDHRSLAVFVGLCRKLLSNRNFVRLLVGFSIVTGVINALMALIDQVGPPSLLKKNLGGLAGALFFAWGCFGAIIISVIVDKTRNYIFIMRCCAAALIPLMVFTFFMWELDEAQGVPVLVGLSLMGFLGIPLFPLSVETGVEVSYSHDANAEGAVNGLIQNFQNIFGVVITLVTTPHLVIHWLGKDEVLVLWGILTMIGLFLMVTTKEDFRRLHREASTEYLSLL